MRNAALLLIGLLTAGPALFAAVPAVSLHRAALEGDLDAVRRHIEAGTDLDARDAWGSTPLIVAITFGRTEVAKALIDAGAGLEVRGNDDATPLHVAAFLGRETTVAALMDAGADRWARNRFGDTPLESVAGPYEDVEAAYRTIARGLAPLGLELDLDRIREARPRIVRRLRPRPEELAAIRYVPLPGDDWPSSTPEKEGLDPALVAELYFDARSLDTLRGLLVVKNGSLLAEDYFHGSSISAKEMLASVSKSFTSALVGLALEQGDLTSLDQRMVEFFPEAAETIEDPRKRRITVGQMLGMRAGYPWEETDPELWKRIWEGSYLSMIAEVPLVDDPGDAFHYSNLTSHWLGIIVARASGKDLRTFGEEHLFSRIAVTPGPWKKDVDGYYIGCAEMHLSAREMARFGQLYLNGGEWNGEAVLPADWVRESLTHHANDAWVTAERSNRIGPWLRELGYGYQWWSASAGARRIVFAWGHGSQLIVLVPDLDLLVVTTADPFYGQHDAASWRAEKAILNVVGKFVASLPERADPVAAPLLHP